MKAKTFTLRFDLEGNSTSVYSNGVIAVKVKMNKLDNTYNIIDVKSGIILITKACVSYRRLQLNVKRDILQLFDIYKSNEEYDLIISKRLNIKNRRI